MRRANLPLVIAMTSLNRNEFEKLCIYFCDAWNAKIESEGRYLSGCGRKPRLTTMEDKLFFILYLLEDLPTSGSNCSPIRYEPKSSQLLDLYAQ